MLLLLFLPPSHQGSEKTTFPCRKWLATSEDDGEIMRELVPSSVFTEKLLKDGTLKQIDEEIDDALESELHAIRWHSTRFFTSDYLQVWKKP